MGAAETLIVWGNLDINLYVLKNCKTGEKVTLQLTPEQEKDNTHFIDEETGAELEVVDKCPLLEWLANEYKHFGTTLEIVIHCSQEGSQFCKGFGGIGSILHYRVDFQSMEAETELDGELYDDDY